MNILYICFVIEIVETIYICNIMLSHGRSATINFSPNLGVMLKLKISFTKKVKFPFFYVTLKLVESLERRFDFG